MSLELIEADLPVGVNGGFTTRAGGVSVGPWGHLNLALHVDDEPRRVLANRDLLTRRLGTSSVNFPQQVHGAGVHVVTGDRAGRRRITHGGAPGVDALVTVEPGVAVGVLVADCMPVLLADPAARVVAAVHAGRAGLAAGILQATVATMAGLGSRPADTVAIIGPAVCGRCYEVPAEMRAAVDADVPGASASTWAGTPSLDLPAGALRLLQDLGLGDVRATGQCTVEDDRFYSYRRDGRTGRFAGVIMLDRDD